MIMKDPIFQGKSEGDQLFAIFNVIGSPSEKEYETLSKKVPFDPKLFKEFPTVPKNSEENDRFSKLFVNFKDKKNLYDILNKIFTYIPEDRITAKEAMQHAFFSEIKSYYSNMNLH